MGESRRHAVGRPHRWGIAALAVAGITLAASAAAAFVASIAARSIITPPAVRVEDTWVLSVNESAGEITFSRTADSSVDGRYGFWFSKAAGYALIGAIVSETASSVTRVLDDVYLGELEVGVRGRFGAWYFLNPGDAGHRYFDVEIDTECGVAPAWCVPAEGETGRWVIMVHGRAVVRAECIRGISVFREAGFTSLLVSYRNDGEAPASSDGLYSLGDTEWRDVDSAVDYALNNGATSIVVMGWSMGGATALQTLTRSARADAITGVVLESPVIDWVRALDHHGKAQGLNLPMRWLVYTLLGAGWAGRLTGLREPIDLARLDFVRRAGELNVPILILHSDDDDYIPSTASHLLAQARPDIVTLDAFSGAGHTRLWNFDERRWNRSIAGWLRSQAGDVERSS